MNQFVRALTVPACAGLLAILSSCTAGGQSSEPSAAPPAATSKTTPVVGDSLVLAGTTAGNLLGTDIDPSTVVVRSTYEKTDKTVTYEAGRDYVLDAKAGTVARTANSRIPDFSTNVLYGKKDFNHGQFPGYGNIGFFVYVDYAARTVPDIHPQPVDVAAQLPKTLEKLKAGKPLKVIGFGDSITAGGEASTVDLQYAPRWIREVLRPRFPKSEITYENGATGGDNTPMGLARLEEKVLTRSPDLVLIAFGMNDHNIGGVPLPQFQDNLRKMISAIRQRTGAEVILLSAFPPNPEWHFGSHQMQSYAEATKAAAAAENAPYADVFGVWERVLKRKDLTSLLGNNINHPNDYGHGLYVVALEGLRF
jgi:lysophospholipase L1-like esterase